MKNAIINRRSIRRFTDTTVADHTIDEIIEMGTWAPSGLNNQPWKFAVISDKPVRDALSQQTKYSRIIQNAPVCIAVFLDKKASYHREKDIQAIGACIQNMLLFIHSRGLGAVWLGEILNKRHKVESIIGVPESLELMAVIALGHPDEQKKPGSRKSVADLIAVRI